MEKYEKIANSKIFKFFEFIYKIIVVNMITFLTIILTLGLTIMPALTALVIVIKGIKEQEEFPLVSTYFYAYAKNFKKMIIVEIPYVLFFILYAFNIYYFYEMIQEYQGTYNEVAYYVSLIILAIAIVAFINACFVAVYFPHLNKKKIIKYSFVLLKITSWKALIMFAVMVAFVFLGALIVFAVPFILLSLYILLYNELIYTDYYKLVPQGYNSLRALDYAIELRERRKRGKN